MKKYRVFITLRFDGVEAASDKQAILACLRSLQDNKQKTRVGSAMVESRRAEVDE